MLNEEEKDEAVNQYKLRVMEAVPHLAILDGELVRDLN
jgi:hypothetical protein